MFARQVVNSRAGPFLHKDIKTCDETTKEMIRQIFNEVLKTRGLHTRNMENNTYKSDLQKKEMWKKLVTAARFALCHHRTNCSQPPYTTDFTADPTSAIRRPERT